MSRLPRIVAIGLLTQHELELLGQGFDRAFPLNDELVFEDLIRAIDEAEQVQMDSVRPGTPRPLGG